MGKSLIIKGADFSQNAIEIQGIINFEILVQKSLNINGEIEDSISEDAQIFVANITPNHTYLIEGYTPTNSSKAAYCLYNKIDDVENFIQGYRDIPAATGEKEMLLTCNLIKIFGRTSIKAPNLYFIS